LNSADQPAKLAQVGCNERLDGIAGKSILFRVLVVLALLAVVETSPMLFSRIELLACPVHKKSVCNA
jgi:hypothetical protein